MKIGSVVLATHQGLGYLARDFYRHGVIDEVLVWDHSSRVNHHNWYPNRCKDFKDLLSKVDIVLFFETPFVWSFIDEARKVGKKTVLMPMYECTPLPNPYEADMVLVPSDLDNKYYPQAKRINVPVPDEIEWKLREKALTFVHNSGNGGLGGRNGTKELIEAMKYVVSPIKLIIRSQSLDLKCDDPRVQIIKDTIPFNKLYADGDIFIFPEKFNGLSLPMQEAFASGMPVICGARFPMTEWLPNELMFPVKQYRKERYGCVFDVAEYDVKEIAKVIDRIYNTDISKYSLLGKEFNEKNQWKVLKEKYVELMSQL